MCEEIQASGNFFISKTKDGKYRLKFTLFDNDSISVEQLQARQIMLLSFLLDLHQGRDCLDVGSLHIHNTREVQGVAHLSCGAEKARESVQVHKCAGDFVCYLQQKEYKWAEQVKKTFSEQDIRMLDYALTYVKKAGIAQFEEELLSIKQVFQTENHNHG
ncbi:hypothetical protein [Rodentibacter trehalosifermentans]|uniref:hypothetical protein n=1 Tax=Rodentibacter trehalosifermentans TaxID=1908263 RepID=UPI0009C42F29|nr:hypothetical protein [Rodentibacter trehalosifermentans]OOF48627.1 hypothetical protein BKK53_09480 [Rodentibacter trehalosifermentans]